MERMTQSPLNHNQYGEKTCNLFHKLINKINELYFYIKSQPNEKCIKLIKELSSNTFDSSIDELSQAIFDGLEIIENYIKKMD